MTMYQDEVVLDGRPDSLAEAVEFIESACVGCGVNEADRFDLQLAAEEACANVIQHAYARRGGRFTLRFEARGPDVVLTLRDNGRPFDPERVTGPDLSVPLEKRPLGGLGLHLMRKLMDEVRFTFSQDEGNTLVMVKRNVVAQPPAGGA